MICMGAGTNHWFHSDQIYRSFISLVLLCGCVGINGGGWAHYVGQEKMRTLAGWQTVAFAARLGAPAAPGAGHARGSSRISGQWRYDRCGPRISPRPSGAAISAG